jgi:glutamyl-tRNA reductase
MQEGGAVHRCRTAALLQEPQSPPVITSDDPLASPGEGDRATLQEPIAIRAQGADWQADPVMTLVCVGIDFNAAPIAVRERLRILKQDIEAALTRLGAAARGRVILSTCMRTEVYLTTVDAAAATRQVEALLATRSGLSIDQIGKLTYRLEGADVVGHLFSLASGVTTPLKGDADIRGQLQLSLSQARKLGATDTNIVRLFRSASKAADKVLHSTGAFGASQSFSDVAVCAAARKLGDLNAYSAMVVGSGTIGSAVVMHLKDQGVESLYVSGTSPEHTADLANASGAELVPFEDLAQAAVEVDLLICASGRGLTLIDRWTAARIMEARGGEPVLWIDVATPRNLPPEVGEIPGITLMNLDDLVAESRESDPATVAGSSVVEKMVAEEAKRFTAATTARPSSPVIRELRFKAALVRETEVSRTMALLDEGEWSPKQLKLLEGLSKTLVNRLLHDPTEYLKKVECETAVHYVAEAFKVK